MEQIELLDKEIENFMGRVPRAITRYGTGVLCVFVLMLLVGSAVFKYPTIVKAPVRIFVRPTTRQAVKIGAENSISANSAPKAHLGKINGAPVSVGESKAVISVVGDGRYVAVVTLMPSDIWKIKGGQRVIIKLERYPYDELGVLEAVVKRITAVITTPDRKSHLYQVALTLPKGLRTTLKHDIFLGEGLFGEAEIVTSNESILERVMKPVFTIRRN